MKNTILQGDVRERLKDIPDESIDCVVTSPPYWGLRDYGTAEWEGGDEKCEHKVGRATRTLTKKSKKQTTNSGSYGDETIKQDGACPHCGAKRIDSQLGLEKTPEEYVENMVQVFREVKRVLKKDGTVFLNLGDSYCGTGSKGEYKDPKHKEGRNGQRVALNNKIQGLKQKDLVGIPWRTALALQADGWYLRQDIIWHKPNPMPESVTDRCTKSHEYIFLLTKDKKYYYDHEAIKEPTSDKSDFGRPLPKKGQFASTKADGVNNNATKARFGNGSLGNPNGRNKRSVWTVTTKPFKEAHFATFPEDLIEPMILTTRKDALILDPFFGAGTTGVVALKNGRSYLGIELNEEYIKIAERRIGGLTKPLL